MSASRDPALAALAHQNMCDAFALLPHHQPGGIVRRYGSVLLAVTRSPIPIFNEVLAIDDPVEEEALARAVGDMRELGVSWVAHLRSDVGDRTASMALELGLREDVDLFYPAMVMTELPTRFEPGADLDVVRFESSEQYDEYVADAGASDGGAPDLRRTWFGPGLLDDPDVAALVGYVDGAPVARSLSIRTGEVVGVYDVGTAEDARRRGYGWAMTLAAVVAGASAGAEVATLQSSRMGFSVYSAHGFERVFDYRCFAEGPSSSL